LEGKERVYSRYTEKMERRWREEKVGDGGGGQERGVLGLFNSCSGESGVRCLGFLLNEGSRGFLSRASVMTNPMLLLS
jgi:hypothetical protein